MTLLATAKVVIMLCSGGTCDCIDLQFQPDLQWNIRFSCSVDPTPAPTPSPSPTATPTATPEPTPTPTPPSCYDGPWTCGPHIDQPILYWGAVEDAVQETIDTDARFSDRMSLPNNTWALWATEVMIRLERDFCVSKSGTDDKDTPSKEELAVWDPNQLVGGKVQREHWDIVVGTRDQIGRDFMFLPTVCTQGR